MTSANVAIERLAARDPRSHWNRIANPGRSSAEPRAPSAPPAPEAATQTAAGSTPALPPVRRYMPDSLLRFRMWCLAEPLDRCRRSRRMRQSPVARSCQHRSRTRAPFLRRHCPASSVLRPRPPPQGAGSAPRGATVGGLRSPAAPRGFPCCTRSLLRTCRRHYPGGTVGCARRSPSPTAAAFPVSQPGRLPHCPFPGLLGVHCTLRPMRSSSTWPWIAEVELTTLGRSSWNVIDGGPGRCGLAIRGSAR